MQLCLLVHYLPHRLIGMLMSLMLLQKKSSKLEIGSNQILQINIVLLQNPCSRIHMKIRVLLQLLLAHQKSQRSLMSMRLLIFDCLRASSPISQKGHLIQIQSMRHEFARLSELIYQRIQIQNLILRLSHHQNVVHQMEFLSYSGHLLLCVGLNLNSHHVFWRDHAVHLQQGQIVHFLEYLPHHRQ